MPTIIDYRLTTTELLILGPAYAPHTGSRQYPSASGLPLSGAQGLQPTPYSLTATELQELSALASALSPTDRSYIIQVLSNQATPSPRVSEL